MKNLYLSHCLRWLIALVIAVFLLPAPFLRAAEVIKGNNATALNLGGSWVDGVVPGAGDIGVWNSDITANRNTALGADLSFGGIRISNPGGAATLMTISGANTLTLGASGIDMSAATVNLTISSAVVLGADQTWKVASGRTLASSGLVSGSGELTIEGPGTVSLTGNSNSYSGGTVLKDGVHVVINSSGTSFTPFGTGTLTVANNAQISGVSTGNRYISNALVLNGDVTFGSSAVTTTMNVIGGIDVGSGARTINIMGSLASISGVGKSIAGTGNGSLAFANGNAGASPAVQVQIGTGGSFSVASDLSVGNNVTLFFAASNVLGVESGLTVQSGGTVDISNKGGAAYNQTIQSLAGAGTVTSERTSPGISTLIIDGGSGTGSTTFSGNIITGTAGASVAVTKQGSTTQVLSGTNNYIGQTQVLAGTLLVHGSHADSGLVTSNGYGVSTSGHYLVAGGATLGGTARIAGNNAQNNSNMVYVQSGGNLAPGASIGTLTLDGANASGTNSRVLNMASGADFSFELAGDGSDADRIEMWNYVSGDLLLNNNEINFTLSGALVEGTHTVTLFEFYSNSGVDLTASGITSGLTIGTLGAGIDGTPLIIYDSAGGTISLQYSVIPEPSTWLLLASGLGALVYLRSRNKLFLSERNGHHRISQTPKP